MEGKGQWVVLSYSVAQYLSGLRIGIILPVVKEERDRRPRWLGSYIYSNSNYKTLPIAALSAMQYGRTLERIIREVVIVDPALGPIYILK